MNYEKFNDAMCRLRQAEEDFNKALQDIQTAYNEYEKELEEKIKQARWEPWSFDNVVKETKDQELSIGDEIEYTYPGRKPEKCIVINLENGIENEKIIWTIGLDLSQLSWFSSNCYWGETYHKTGKHYDFIPLKKEDSNKRNEYRDQEFHVGDEVKHEHGRKGIITNINDNGKTLWITYKSTNGFGFDYCWVPKDTSEKTGRHFDSIPFDYQQEEEETI